MTIRHVLPITLISLSLAAGAVLSGCATAENDHDQLPTLEMPTCSGGEAIVSGTVDGDKVEAEANAIADARYFGDTGYLDLSLDSGDQVVVTWDEPLRDGAAVSAGGILEVAGNDDGYSNCADSLPGLIEYDPATGRITFHLVDLHHNGLCDGAPPLGDIVGCVGSVNLTPL